MYLLVVLSVIFVLGLAALPLEDEGTIVVLVLALLLEDAGVAVLYDCEAVGTAVAVRAPLGVVVVALVVVDVLPPVTALLPADLALVERLYISFCVEAYALPDELLVA